MKKLVTWFFVIIASLSNPVSWAKGLGENLVVLMYHNVDENTPPITSVTPQVFAEHMAFVSENFNVIDLNDGINAIRSGKQLPDNSVAITFDDGYSNILHNAHPILQKYQFPYTIFINPGRISSEKRQLSWAEVKAMQKDGVVFANHTMDHAHLLNKHQGETPDQWLARVMANIEQAQTELTHQLGEVHKLFAYPYGEFNASLARAIEEAGYVGFGQHSGAISPDSHYGALPRFPAAGIYANLKTLKTKLFSLAMPVYETRPADPERKLGEHIEMAFSVDRSGLSTNTITCFFAGEVIAHQTVGNEVIINASNELPTGRSRVNCTAPSQLNKGRYFWFSQPFFVPDENGQYID